MTAVGQPIRRSELSFWVRQWDKGRRRFRRSLGRFLDWLGVPGFVQPMEVDDLVTGWHLSIRVSPLFTVISVEGRDFYFYRRNGKFDGTGMSTCAYAKLCEKRRAYRDAEAIS